MNLSKEEMREYQRARRKRSGVDHVAQIYDNTYYKSCLKKKPEMWERYQRFKRQKEF